MSWFTFQPQNDMDRGRQAVTYFHNNSVGVGNYSETIDSLIDKVSTTPSGRTDNGAFLDGFGFAMSSIDMSDSQVSGAMARLARTAAGRVPSQGAFFKALSDRMEDISASDWIGALPGIAADSAIDIAKGAQAVGDSVIATGKTLTMLLPVVAVAAVLFIVYSRSKQLAG